MGKGKRDIRQEPEYQELINLLNGMSEDRRELLGQALQDMETTENKAYYTTEQAAEILDVKQATIRLWLRSGKLKARRFGGRWRIPADVVDSMKQAANGE